MTTLIASPEARQGMMLAVALMEALENQDGEPHPADLAELGFDRQGQEFHNIVLERLEKARAVGSAAEAGFCAALSTLVAVNAVGYGMTSAGLLKRVEKETRRR